MERKLVAVAGVAIVVAGALLHFVYGWSGRNAMVGLVSPVNESVWEHTKLLVVPVVVAGGVEAVLLRDVRRVAWAVLVESVVGALAIIAVFYTYTGAFGAGPILWVDITTFVLIAAGGQWVHLQVLVSRRFPPWLVSVFGVAAVLGLYVVFTVSPPDLPVFQPGSSVPAGLGQSRASVVPGFAGRSAGSARTVNIGGCRRGYQDATDLSIGIPAQGNPPGSWGCAISVRSLLPRGPCRIVFRDHSGGKCCVSKRLWPLS